MDRTKIGKLICRLISSSVQDKQFVSKLSNFSNSDWEDVYSFAENVKLLPILFYKLKSFTGLAAIPSNIELKMHGAYIASSAQSLKIQHQLKEIINALNNKKIDVIILKGAHLSNTYYQHPGLRPMSDIDILVRERDIQSSYQCLVELGYTSSKEFKAEVIDLYRKHIPPLNSNNKYSVEVHKELIQPRKEYLGNIEINDIWNNTSHAIFLNHKTISIRAEHLIIYLAYAIAEDDFKYKILHLYDIYLIINKENIDWHYMVNQASAWGTAKPLLCVLLLLEQNFNMRYRESVVKELTRHLDKCTVVKSLEHQLKTIFFENALESDINKERINQYCSNYGFFDTFKFASKILFSHRWYIYKYGIQDNKNLFLYYRMQAIREVFNGYLKPFIKYVLFGKKASLKKDEGMKDSKDFFNWLKEG